MLNKHKKKRTIQTTSRAITEQERAENRKIAEKLQQSDLTVFNQMEVFGLVGDTKKEFLEIFDTYTQNHKISLPTKESLGYIEEQLKKDQRTGTNFFATMTIGINTRDLDARSYRELIDYAFAEFGKADLYDCAFIKDIRNIFIIVVYDFIIRHPEIVWTLQRISQLRHKIRKEQDLEVGEFVGF